MGKKKSLHHIRLCSASKTPILSKCWPARAGLQRSYLYLEAGHCYCAAPHKAHTTYWKQANAINNMGAIHRWNAGRGWIQPDLEDTLPIGHCRVTGGLCARPPMTHRLLLKGAGKPLKCIHLNPYAFIRIQHSFSEQCITIFQTCTFSMCQQRWLVKTSKFTDYPPAWAFCVFLKKLSQQHTGAHIKCCFRKT